MDRAWCYLWLGIIPYPRHPVRVLEHTPHGQRVLFQQPWRGVGILSWIASVPIFWSASASVVTRDWTGPRDSVVPRPLTWAAKILAEKPLHCFFESYLSGATTDANICPNTGKSSSGDAMGCNGMGEGPGDRMGPCSPLTHCHHGVSHPFLSPISHYFRCSHFLILV